MRRDEFLKSLLAAAATAGAGSLPGIASAATTLKMMIPANPGGGWHGPRSGQGFDGSQSV
jgi:putative tricarboxylic transport membrane protein